MLVFPPNHTILFRDILRIILKYLHIMIRIMAGMSNPTISLNRPPIYVETLCIDRMIVSPGT